MFSYTLPCGGFKTITNVTEKGITFDPPVCEQRYSAVIQILEDSRWVQELKKVTEFGCGEMRLFPLMRRIESIENILQVDIDEALLNNYKKRTNPLVSDFIRQRASPLHVEVLHGSAIDWSEKLMGTDAVVGVELIEHMYEDVLSELPKNIFGFIQPKLAIFSTPNVEFNEIFLKFSPLLANGFRHADHKFEWTREQFKSWCLNIIAEYPNYMFSLMGVGDPPTGYESVGHVSQVGLFVRKDILNLPLEKPLKLDMEIEDKKSYKCLLDVDYPYFADTRSKEEILWSEVGFEIQRLTTDDNYDIDEHLYKLPFPELLARTQYYGSTEEILNKLLKEKGYKVEDGFVIIESDDSDFSLSNASIDTDTDLSKNDFGFDPSSSEEERWSM